MNGFAPRTYFLFFALIFALIFTSCHNYFVRRGEAAYTRLQIDSTLEDDASLIQLYASYRSQLDAEMSQVIGYSDVDLNKPADAVETLLGNFFADALLAEGRKLDPDAEFSFGTKGGLRTELPRGEITIGNLFELMPFENELVLLELSGESVRQLAEFIAATDGQPVSGLRMTISEGKPANITIAGKPLDRSRTYKLVTYDYLANGGDNSRGLDHPVGRTNLGQKVREALITYVSERTAAGNHINTQLDGRITRD